MVVYAFTRIQDFSLLQARYFIIAVLACVCLILTSVVVLGITEDDTDSVYKLDEFVVQAWSIENDSLEVAADVVTIDRDTIDQSLALSVPELLETEANLFFTTMSGFTSVSMRGFGENSGLRSLILVDGQALNPSDMGRINWEQIPLDAIESIEVLRGGHNVLYGDKALTGVIKIETRRSSEERVDFEGRLGSFGSEQASLSGATGGDIWTVSSGFSRQSSDGFRENSDSETRNVYLNVGYDFTNGDELDLRLALGETDLSYPSGLDYETYQNDPTSSSNLGDQGSENSYASLTGRAIGERDWGTWEVLSGIDQNYIEWSFGAGSYGENAQIGYHLKPRLNFQLDDWELIVGTDLLYDELEFTSYLDEDRTIIPSEAELSESRISPYLFSEYKLSPSLTISAGVRHEWIHYQAKNIAYVEDQLYPTIETNRGSRPNVNYKNPADIDTDESYNESLRESGFSAEFSINFRLTEHLSLWAGYDRAYRYPVFDERAAYQGYPLAESIAQNLEAEEGDQLELGLKWARGVHEFYATVYLLQMENEIIYDPSVGVDDMTTLGNGLNVNMGPVDRSGADVSYFYSGADWGFSVAMAWVQTKMRADVSGEGLGQEVPLVPSLVATSQIWWQIGESLRLRFTHRYVSERFQGGDFSNDAEPIDAYQLFDAQAEYQVSSNCRLFVKAENLLDMLYAETVYYGSYYPGAGRSLQVGVKINF
jgi:iron complex outermembrane receptor protein